MNMSIENNTLHLLLHIFSLSLLLVDIVKGVDKRENSELESNSTAFDYVHHDRGIFQVFLIAV